MGKLLSGLIIAGIAFAAGKALSNDAANESAPTNEHDAEKEIFRAHPMSDERYADASGVTRVISTGCSFCGGVMQQKDNTLICPYCGAKTILPEHPNVQVARSRHSAYQEVERGKQEAHTKIALEREKTARNSDRTLLIIIAFGLLFPLIFFVLMELDIAHNAPDHTFEVQVPMAHKEYEGEEYATVVSALEAAGFTNVQAEGLEDLKLGLLKKEGNVDKVYINGNANFAEGTWFPTNAEIIVKYHSFEKKNK